MRPTIALAAVFAAALFPSAAVLAEEPPIPAGWGRLRVRVVSAAGAPIAGARVTPDRRDGHGEPYELAQRELPYTDTAGRFALDIAPGTFAVCVWRTGWLGPAVPPTATVTAGAVTDAGDIVLERTGAGFVLVRARTPGGEPYVGDFELAAEAAGGGARRQFRHMDADATGLAYPRRGLQRGETAALELDAGRYRLTPSRKGNLFGEVPLDVPDGATREAVFVIEPVPEIAVRVVADGNGRPLAGTLVAADALEGGRKYAAEGKTDAAGVARLVTRPGRYRISAKGGDFCELVDPSTRLRIASLELDIGAGEPAPALRAARGPEVLGRVLDRDGRPVPGAWVHTVLTSRYGEPHLVAADGSFRLAGVEWSELLEVGAPGFGTARRRVPAEAGKPARASFVLSPGGSLRGRIAAADGGELHVLDIRLEPRFSLGPDDTRPFWAPNPVDFARDGSFAIDGIIPGRYELVVRAKGAMALHREVEVRAGVTVALDFALERGGRIAGRVVDERGKPVPGAGVFCRATGRGADGQPTRTDGDGRFELRGLADARYDVKVSGGGCLDGCVRDVRTGTSGLAVAVRRAAELRLHVIAPSGRGLGGAEVDLQLVGPEGPSRQAIRLDETGRASVSVDPLVERVDVAAGSHALRSFPGLRLAPGESREIEIRLE